ncbi:MAG: type IV toxin-antitoxin system AbiEi family antitoxin [Planctomycetes bacterium]|nr:type IV toxin-antitoxin system AbiEi family antitoxin [Planctomycetota bacterium]
MDRLQGSGRYTFTAGEVAKVLGGSDAAREAALRRLKRKGRIVSPRRGFFVIVPVEYRSAGSPPATWFIDDLMAYQGRPYYVGLLTAAEIHGAAHQRPQVFQVLTDVPMRPVEVGRVRIEFHRSRNTRAVPVERAKTETGSMRVSTPEATALDLMRYPEACGYLDNVATVLKELVERIDPRRIAKAVGSGRHPDAQRLGFLLEHLGLEKVAAPLARVVASWRRRPVLLRPERGARGLKHDPRWYVVPNEEVASEL